MSAVRIDLDAGTLLAIGLMSGTSHDGVSAAMVEIDEDARPPAKVIAFRTVPGSYQARRRAAE